MLQLCETLKGDSGTVIERWTHLTHGAPWSELSTEQLIDHLPALLYAIIDAALCDENEPARRRVISEAYRHGVHRQPRKGIHSPRDQCKRHEPDDQFVLN